MFLHVPAVLSTAQTAAVEATLSAADAPWVDGRVTAGYQGALVKRNQQIEESSCVARELGALIVAQLEHHPLFISAVLPLRVYPPMFNRYGEGMAFGSHVDGAIRSVPGSGQKLRTDLSATLFLAPPTAYEGGELIIENDLGDRSFKLAAGDMIVYTSTARHRVSTVTRGVRVASVFWIQSLIRDDLQREQLFELDQTIQRLTCDRAAATNVLQLTALYHTLLRLWTEL